MINAFECNTLEKAVQWAKENPPKIITEDELNDVKKWKIKEIGEKN